MTRTRYAARLAVAAVLSAATLAACSTDDDLGEVPAPRATSTTASPSGTPAPSSATPAPRSTEVPALAVEVVAEGFEHGWDIGFLPDGTALVTERPGRFSLVWGCGRGRR